MTYGELVTLLQRTIPADAPFIGETDLRVLVSRLTGTTSGWPPLNGLIRRGYAVMVPGSAGVYLVTKCTIGDNGEVPGTGTPITGIDA